MRKILFISLGCDKNLVDTEYMIGSLAGSGYEITDDDAKADVIVINTCSFIHDAQDESVSNILSMAKHKEDGNLKALIIAGCLAQQYGDDILDELPEVDAVIGTNSYDMLPQIIERVLEGERVVVKNELTGLPKNNGKRIMTTGGHFEYLKIAEGCDKHCTYCVIPSLRGRYRSVPMEQLLDEARTLAENGVAELNIVAQETTLYGADIYGRKSLHILLEKLCEIEEIHWIRLLYTYPEEIYPELIDTIKNNKKICNYLDMPIQHCSDDILKRMGRKTDKSDIIDIISTLRKEIPDIALRTTLITGFPGETEEQHEELKRFVSEMRFDRLGVFTYSRQDGTPAASMPDQIEEDVKEQRKEEIMLIQQEISADKNSGQIGKSREVFVEGYIPEEDIYVGRSYADAPNIDGYVFFNAYSTLDSGVFVNCNITESSEYDLIGEMYEFAE
ncbi:MAG: 30S ribosomal protein S12 methylthiotransferase RimO [Candidatus Alectryocaccobium sp.]|jgi:ribosomal protein S12 methylthiotransferase